MSSCQISDSDANGVARDAFSLLASYHFVFYVSENLEYHFRVSFYQYLLSLFRRRKNFFFFFSSPEDNRLSTSQDFA